MDPSLYGNNSGSESDLLNLEDISDVNAIIQCESTGNLLTQGGVDTLFGEQSFVLQDFSSQELREVIGNDPGHTSADSTSNQLTDFYHQSHNNTATGHLPATDDYPGDFHFYIKMEEVEPNKNKWAYSSKLNKLFIKSERIIAVPFQWIPTEPDLMVRALPIFSDAQHMKKPVKRCYNHSNPSDSTNNGFQQLIEHVLRSENSGALYEKNEESQRCSVVVPLEDLQPGCTTMPIMYKFMCQTTCSGGLDRRPTTILFTLERLNGEVLGRQKLQVKICSCPKRDMDKEEKNFNGDCSSRKRPLAEVELHPKKIKRENNEDELRLDMQFTEPKLFKSALKRLQECFLRHSRKSGTGPIAQEATRLLPQLDDQLKRLK